MDTYMHSDEFQKRFLPTQNKTGGRPRVMPLSVASQIVKSKTAEQLSMIWAKWLNPATRDAKGPCPGHRITVSDPKPSTTDHTNPRVDGAFHHKSDSPADEPPHWEIETALWEFREDEYFSDAFDGVMGNEQPDTQEKNRVKASEYVLQTYGKQHRNSMFVFLVNGTEMRVTRWDRSETIFTESFDYTEKRELLRDILWGFSLLDAEGQGQDMTATVLKPEDQDYKTMDEVARPCPTDLLATAGTAVNPNLQRPYTFIYVRQLFANSLKDALLKNKVPRYRIEVPCEHGPRSFLIGRSIVVPDCITGRGSREYVAWDPILCQFVFLKDAWRPHWMNVQTEGKALRALQAAGVKNVPTYVCDGELPVNQVTRNPYGEDAPADGMLPYRHYRLVVKELCITLHNFRNGKQLISILRDCVAAHAGAVEAAKILHRDISTGNMLVLPVVVLEDDGVWRVVWKGVLIDWEFSMSLDPANEEFRARLPVPYKGTWQFASWKILDDPDKLHAVSDEIEGYFNVTLYYGLRYMRHTCKALSDTMDQYFEAGVCLPDGQWMCGYSKRDAMLHGRLRDLNGCNYFFVGNGEAPHPLNTLLDTMLDWFKNHYLTHLYSWATVTGDASTSTVPAQPLKDHSAFLALLDRVLAMPNWPADDKVGDQLEPPAPSADADEPNGTQGNGGSKRKATNEEIEQPPRKRPKTRGGDKGKGKARQEPDEPKVRRAAKTVRKRGDGANKASGSGIQSSYNLRPRKSRR